MGSGRNDVICTGGKAMIELSYELKNSLANSMTDRIAVIAAYVDRRGDPHVGFYGSLHAYSDNQLAVWARNPDSELVATIPAHPKIEFVYSDMANARVYRLGGSARIVTDPVERDRVYEGIHEIEQGHDPERTGIAIVIDLDHVSGRDSSGRFAMRRDD
jgi:hypothetical protein